MIPGLDNLVNMASQLSIGAMNVASQQMTNKANLQIMRETNAANVEQANLAYERSLPVNQVANMMNAGMSRAGALNALSGGGTYTAPVLQSTSLSPAKFDPIQFGAMDILEAAQRFMNIPQNVNQLELQQAELDKVRQDIRHQAEKEKRASDLHQYQLWKEQYGKESATKLDSAKNLIMSALLDSDKDINDFSSFKDLISSLGLKDNKDLQDLPALAWNQLESDIRSSFADARAEREQQNRDVAAYDAHQLSLMEQAFKKIDYKYYNQEKHEKLLNLMRVGQGLIEDNNIKFQDRTAKEMENYVREAGLENERDARALAEYVNKLLQDDELDIALKRISANKNTLGVHNQFRVVLRDLGELLMKVKL